MPFTPLSRNLALASALSFVYAAYGEDIGIKIQPTKSKAANFFLAAIPSLYVAYKLTNAFESREKNKPDATSILQRNNMYDIPPGGKEPTHTLNCVAIFDDPTGPSTEYLLRTVSKLLRYDNMASILNPCSPLWLSRWVQYDNPSPSEFIEEESLPPDSEQSLNSRIEQICNEDLDYTKPAWKIHMIRNCPNNQSAIILRVAHWIGDGIRLAEVLSDAVLTDVDGNPIGPPVIKPSGIVRRPPRKIDTKGFKPIEKGMPFHQPLTFPQRFKFAVNERVISLEKVRALKSALNCTVNDVLVSAVCGAIRRYVKMTDEAFFENEKNDGFMYSGAISVGQKSEGVFARQSDWLGNNFGAIGMVLPVHVEDFGERCEWVRYHVEKGRGFVAAGGAFVKVVLQLGLDAMMKPMTTTFMEGTCVLSSNVPGWQFPCFVDGFEMKKLYVLAGAAKPVVVFVSYNGMISAVWGVDDACVPNSECLVEFLVDEIDDAHDSL